MTQAKPKAAKESIAEPKGRAQPELAGLASSFQAAISLKEKVRKTCTVIQTLRTIRQMTAIFWAMPMSFAPPKIAITLVMARIMITERAIMGLEWGSAPVKLEMRLARGTAAI